MKKRLNNTNKGGEKPPTNLNTMRKQRFRISKNDEIKATASGSAGLLSSLYDSQFTTIGEVIGVLLRKIPYYSGGKIEVKIWNITKDEVKNLTINVNK